MKFADLISKVDATSINTNSMVFKQNIVTTISRYMN